MSDERTIVVRRFKTGSVFRILAAGIFSALVPLTIVLGIFAGFGFETVNWNNEPVTGIAGLALSPIIGLLIAAGFTGFGGVCIAFGLWLYSKFRPLRLQYIVERDVSQET